MEEFQDISESVEQIDQSNELEKANGKQETLWEKCSRVGTVALTFPMLLVGFGVISFFPDYTMDPKVISNKLTPVLLIHGSNSNQQQWVIFRQLLSVHGVGHVFTVNLNKSPLRNDPNRDILDYARTVHNKLVCMKNLYTKAGLKMDKVILVGNSMGGLVGAAYCCSEFANIDEPLFKVSALITISTPWKGSPLADVFCSQHSFPEKYFRRKSDDRDNLTTEMMKRCCDIPVYTYGSTLDLIVTPESSKFPSSQDEWIDNRNDHLTTMIDGVLAEHVAQKWISHHLEELEPLTLEEKQTIKEEISSIKKQQAYIQ